MAYTVLVPLDGSAFGEEALVTAGKLASAGNTRVVLLHIYALPREVARDEDGRVIGYIDQQDEALRREAQEYLHDVAARFQATYGVSDLLTQAFPGEPVQGIIDAARRDEADLIVMATHGRTGVARVMLGSVAGTVLRRGTVPVTLVIPAGVREAHAEADEAAAQPVQHQAVH